MLLSQWEPCHTVTKSLQLFAYIDFTNQQYSTTLHYTIRQRSFEWEKRPNKGLTGTKTETGLRHRPKSNPAWCVTSHRVFMSNIAPPIPSHHAPRPPDSPVPLNVLFTWHRCDDEPSSTLRETCSTCSSPYARTVPICHGGPSRWLYGTGQSSLQRLKGLAVWPPPFLPPLDLSTPAERLSQQRHETDPTLWGTLCLQTANAYVWVNASGLRGPAPPTAVRLAQKLVAVPGCDSSLKSRGNSSSTIGGGERSGVCVCVCVCVPVNSCGPSADCVCVCVCV